MPRRGRWFPAGSQGVGLFGARIASRSEAAALLSAREREIAMLAVQGQSNMEITRELSITHKMVEKHLGSAY